MVISTLLGIVAMSLTYGTIHDNWISPVFCKKLVKNGNVVVESIENYYKVEGEYPKKLKALIPDYISSENMIIKHLGISYSVNYHLFDSNDEYKVYYHISGIINSLMWMDYGRQFVFYSSERPVEKLRTRKRKYDKWVLELKYRDFKREHELREQYKNPSKVEYSVKNL
jgi:hypothetical protein